MCMGTLMFKNSVRYEQTVICTEAKNRTLIWFGSGHSSQSPPSGVTVHVSVEVSQ